MSDILQAKEMINDRISKYYIKDKIPFEGFQKAFFWTNENINGYLGLVDLKHFSRALSVTGSGDHAFNLISKGILNVDTFDINRFSEFVALGLKRSMILKYSYEEFLDIIKKIESNTNDFEILEIFSDLIPYMDQEYRKFWKEIIDYLNNLLKTKDIGSVIKLLFVGSNSFFYLTKINHYLASKENYERFKDNLKKANITYRNANAMNIDEEVSGTYDIILLSNILDYYTCTVKRYWDYAFLKEYEKKLERISNDKGIIFLNYIFSCNFYDSLVMGTNITEKDLTDEELLKFNLLLPDGEIHTEEEVLLKRVRK